MNTGPTDAEINGTIANFCGWIRCTCYLGCSAWTNGVAHFTSSFDALREAMEKMTEGQREALNVILWAKFRETDQPCMDYSEWLLFHCPVRTLAEAVYQVVKGENK